MNDSDSRYLWETVYFLSYELEFSDKSCHIVFFHPVCELGNTVSILQMNKSRTSEISTNLLQVIPQYLVKKKRKMKTKRENTNSCWLSSKLMLFSILFSVVNSKVMFHSVLTASLCLSQYICKLFEYNDFFSEEFEFLFLISPNAKMSLINS